MNKKNNNWIWLSFNLGTERITPFSTCITLQIIFSLIRRPWRITRSSMCQVSISYCLLLRARQEFRHGKDPHPNQTGLFFASWDLVT